MAVRQIADPNQKALIPRKRTLGVAAVLAVALLTGAGLATTVEAAHATTASAKVAQVANRTGFGDILVTTKGAALYVDTNKGKCTGGCLTAWPPLLMPAGKTTPTGTAGLGTTPFGTSGQLQVTYQSMPLYTYSKDSGAQRARERGRRIFRYQDRLLIVSLAG